jgi:hypothetical protein
MKNNKFIIFILTYVFCGLILLPAQDLFPRSLFSTLSNTTDSQILFNPTAYTKAAQTGVTVYPHVSTSPQSPFYILTTLREVQSLLTKNYDPLFISQKRVAELLQWGRKLDIHNGKIPQDGVVSINEACTHNRYEKEGSWENELCKYSSLIQQKQVEFESAQRNGELVDLLNTVNNNCADLKAYVTSNITQIHQARYLTGLIDSVQNNIEKRVLMTTSVSTAGTVMIPLSNLNLKEDFNSFSMSLYPIHEEEIKNIKYVRLDEQSVYPTRTYDKSNETLTFHSLPKKADNARAYSHISILSAPNKATLITNWTSNPKNNALMTFFTVENQHFTNTYHFQLKSKNNVVVRFEQAQNENAISTISENIAKPDAKGNIEFASQFGGNPYADGQRVKLTLTPQLPGGPMKPESIHADVTQTPVYSLYLTGESIEYNLHEPSYDEQPQMKINVTRTHPLYVDPSLLAQSIPLWTIVSIKTADHGLYSTTTFTYQYLPFRFMYGFLGLMAAIIIASLFIPYLKKTAGEIVRITKVQKVHATLYTIAQDIKFGLLVFLLIFFIIDLLFFSRTFEPLYVVIIFVLWFCLEVFKPDHRDMIFISLLLFLGVIIAPHFKNEQKFAVWSFMILAISTIYAVMTSVKEEHESIPSVMLSFCMPKLQRARYALEHKAKMIAAKIMRVARRYYINHPQTTSQYIQNSFFFFFLFILIGSLSITSFISVRFVKHQIAVYKEAQQELHIHPIIEKIEPELGYFGTKVILRGNRFGWIEHDHVQLDVDGWALKTDLWTNEKIIFTIPIEWGTGVKNMSVIKKTSWKNKPVNARSNIVHFQLLNRSASINKLDEKYLDSIKNWSEEAKKINGYQE